MHFAHGILAGVCCLTSLSACVTARVALPPAPPASAPLEQRVAFYGAHRPTVALGTTMYQNYMFGPSVPVASSWNQLVLANGTVVNDPRDLAQVVGLDSAVAAAANEAERQSTVATGLFAGGLAGSLLGLVLTMASIDQFTGDGYPALFWAGIGLSTLGSTALMIGRYGFSASANTSRAAAFQAYDGGLRTRLNLCETRGSLHDCSAPADASPPPPPPASPWSAPPTSGAWR